MYEMIIEKSPNFNDFDGIYASDVKDVASSLESILGGKSDVEVNGNTITFNSDLSSDDIKTLMKKVFVYHIENVRFVSLIRMYHE